jgi:uncharacterized protein (DUF1499 family)
MNQSGTESPNKALLRKNVLRRFRLRLLFLPMIAMAMLIGMNLMATRPKNLGVTNGRLFPLPETANCVSTQAATESQQMEPIRFHGSGEDAMKKLISVVEAQSRMTIISQRDNYLYAEARSLIFRFVDDVEFLVEDETNFIQFRSASRVGYSDLGTNRRRMERIKSAFERSQ